jgi:hypothetical protein
MCVPEEIYQKLDKVFVTMPANPEQAPDAIMPQLFRPNSLSNIPN